MGRLASLRTHRILEELLAWLEHLQAPGEREGRERLVFAREVLPRFVEALPELCQALNEAGSDPLEGEPRRFLGPRWHRPPPSPPAEQAEYASARVRTRADGEREKQCIGPVVGERGRCVGRGAATEGWQPESAEVFARKRSQFQARCKACDSHRSPGRQRELARRSAGARVWLELSQQAETLSPSETVARARRMSLTFIEELRADWWTAMQHKARRIIDVSAASEPWLAVDVDRKRVFAGSSPKAALAAAGGEDGERLLIVLPRREAP